LIFFDLGRRSIAEVSSSAVFSESVLSPFVSIGISLRCLGCIRHSLTTTADLDLLRKYYSLSDSLLLLTNRVSLPFLADVLLWPFANFVTLSVAYSSPLLVAAVVDYC
jgi:hypothetical protein